MSRDDETDPDDRPRPRRRREDDDDPDDRPRRGHPDDRLDDRDEPDDRPRRRRDEPDGGGGPWGDFADRPRRRRQPLPDPNAPNGWATAGLVLGILSIFTACLAGVPAIVVSAVAMARPGKRGAATAGLVLGLLGTFLTLPLMIGLLLPAVQKVREAAAKAQDSNNLKELSLAAWKHESATGTWPAGNGPVSWRVHLLPYLGQQPLYQQFETTQPWDSPRNRPLANTYVKTFYSPLDPPGTTETRYRVFTGPETMFPPGRVPLRAVDITDGTANTIFAVDAPEAVPWPQPKELPLPRGGQPPEVGDPGRDVVIVAFADGSVKPIKKSKLTPDLLRKLATANGGEVFTLD